MEALFVTLVNMSITASWLVLAIIGVRLVFRKTPKWILCLLWGLVALRLIFPFSLESALSLIPSTQTLPQEIVYTAQPEIHSGIEAVDSVVNPVLEENMTVPEPAVTSANPTQIWSFLLSVTWAAGCGCMLLYALVSYLLLKHRVAAAIPLEKGIKQSELVDSPFVLGLFRPVIYLPISISPKDLPYVVAHEQSHIRRGDHWWKPVGFVLLSVYWFNPVLWVAYILLCRDIEAACDERVIRDMGMEDRRAYSTALLNCSIRRKSIAACPLAFGEVGVKERIKSVMHYKKPGFWILLAALVVTIVVAVCFLTNPVAPQKVQWLDAGAEPDTSLQCKTMEQTYYHDGVMTGTAKTEHYYGNGGQRLYMIDYRDGEIIGKTITDMDAYGNIVGSTFYLPDGITQTDILEYQVTLDWRHRLVRKESYSGDTVLMRYECEYDWRGNAVWEQTTQMYGENGEVSFVSRTKRTYNLLGQQTLKEVQQEFGGGITRSVTEYEDGKPVKGTEYAEDGTVLSETEYIYNVEGNPQEKIIRYKDAEVDDHHEIYAYQEDGYTITVVSGNRPDWETGPSDSMYFCDYDGNVLRRQWRTNGYVTWLVQYDYEPKGQTVDDEAFLAQFQQPSDEIPMPEGISSMNIWYGDGMARLDKGEEVVPLLEMLTQAFEQSPVPADSVAEKIQNGFTWNYIAVNHTDDTTTEYCLSEDCDLIWKDAPLRQRQIYSLEQWDWIQDYFARLTNGVKDRQTTGQPFAAKDEIFNWTQNVTTNAIEKVSANIQWLTPINQHGVRDTHTSEGILTQESLDKLLDIFHQIPESAFTPQEKEKLSYRNLYNTLGEDNTRCAAISIMDTVNSLWVLIRYSEEGMGILLSDELQKAVDGSGAFLESYQYWSVEDAALEEYMRTLIEQRPIVNYMEGAVGTRYPWETTVNFSYDDLDLTLHLIEGWEYEIVEGEPQATNYGIRCRPGDVSTGWLYFSFWPEGYHPEESNRFYLESSWYDYPTKYSFPESVINPDGGYSVGGKAWSYWVVYTPKGDLAVINQGADSWFPEYADVIDCMLMMCQMTLYD